MEEKFTIETFEIQKTPSKKIVDPEGIQPDFYSDAKLEVKISLRCFGDGEGISEKEIENYFSAMMLKENKNEADALETITAREFLNEFYKNISKYEKKHSHVELKTCDIDDVWKWIEKTEKKLKKNNLR